MGDSDTLGRIRSWSRIPPLAKQLQWLPGGDPSHVRLFDPTTSRLLELSQLERTVARMLDGQSSLADLVARAQKTDPSIQAAQVEPLIVNLVDLEFIEHDEFDALQNTLMRSTRAMRASLNKSVGVLGIPDDLFKSSDGLFRSSEGAGPSGTTSVVAPVKPAPPPEPTASSGTASPPKSATPESVAAEEEQAWDDHKTRVPLWKRRWLRVLAFVAVVVTASALIQYPLYVTSEMSIVPAESSHVRASMAGVLAEILVHEGDIVYKGDVLARLDVRDLTADRTRAEAQIDRITAELARLRNGGRPGESEQQRSVVLPEEIVAAEAALKQAKAERDLVDQKITDMAVIRAPRDGVVLTPKLHQRLGERVEAGGLVCEVANIAAMHAEIYVPEREADTIALGMPVVVKVESYPLHPFTGKVDFIAPAVEARATARTLRVVASFDNRRFMLRQNMTGYGEINCGKRSLLNLATRRMLRWVRVRLLL